MTEAKHCCATKKRSWSSLHLYSWTKFVWTPVTKEDINGYLVTWWLVAPAFPQAFPTHSEWRDRKRQREKWSQVLSCLARDLAPRTVSWCVCICLCPPSAHVNFKFPLEPSKQERRWHYIRPKIDSKCRAQRKMHREKLARMDNTPLASTRICEASLLDDRREKELLLYGSTKS